MHNFDNGSRNQKDYNYPIVILDKDKYLENLLLYEIFENRKDSDILVDINFNQIIELIKKEKITLKGISI